MNGNEQVVSPRWPPLGLRRQRLKYGPIAYVQGAPQVPELAGKRFYFYVFRRLTLAGLATGEALITTDRPFWCTALLGQGTVAGAVVANSFRFQMADQGVRKDRTDRLFYQNAKSIVSGLALCTAQAAFVFPLPHFIPANHPIALRVVNMNAAQNLVDVIMAGYVNSPLEGWKVDDPGIPSDPATNRAFPGME